MDIKQKPYTQEQYERCLKIATELSHICTIIERMPLTPEILKELYDTNRKYNSTITDVVNESSD